MGRTRVLLVASLPPPYTGQEVLARTWLEAGLDSTCHLDHLRANVQTRVTSKGKIGASSLARFFLVLAKLFFRLLFDRPHVLLSYVTATPAGFARDALIALLARALGVRVLWHYPGDVFRRFFERGGPRRKRFMRWVFRHIAGVIVVSEGLRPEFEGLVAPESVFVLPNGTAAPRELPAKEWAGPLEVVFLGWISYVKGFYDLIRALEKTEGRARFTFAGELIDRGMAFSFAARFLQGAALDRYRQDQDRIQSTIEDALRARPGREWTWKGVVDEDGKRALLRQGHVLVIASYAEGFPLVALEAMAMGCAVVVSRAGALAEIIRDGQEGFVVDAGNPDALADRLLRLSAEPELRRRMGEAGRRLVMERFDMAVISRRLSEICVEVGRPSSGRRAAQPFSALTK